MAELRHKAKRCNVRGCRDEARYWLSTDEMSGDFDVQGDTFYICDNHIDDIADEECAYYRYLNPETGRIREIEIGVYSCNDECATCN